MLPDKRLVTASYNFHKAPRLPCGIGSSRQSRQHLADTFDNTFLVTSRIFLFRQIALGIIDRDHFPVLADS